MFMMLTRLLGSSHASQSVAGRPESVPQLTHGPARSAARWSRHAGSWLEWVRESSLLAVTSVALLPLLMLAVQPRVPQNFQVSLEALSSASSFDRIRNAFPLSRSGEVLLFRPSGRVEILGADRQTSLLELDPLLGKPTHIAACSQTGRIAVLTQTGVVAIFDDRVETFEISLPVDLARSVTHLALANEGSRLCLAAENEGLLILPVEQATHTLLPEPTPPLDFEASPSDGAELFQSIVPLTASISSLAIDPTTERLAIGLCNGQLLLLDPLSGQLTAEITAGCGRVQTIAWSPSGEQLALSVGVLVSVMNVETHDTLWLRPVGGHLMCEALCFTSDGLALAYAGPEKQLFVTRWSDLQAPPTSTETLTGHAGPIRAIAPDLSLDVASGEFGLVSASLDGTWRYWRLPLNPRG